MSMPTLAGAQRASTAAATVDAISAEWPDVADAMREMQAATAPATETARRQQELEQAIAANFSISLSSKSAEASRPVPRREGGVWAGRRRRLRVRSARQLCSAELGCAHQKGGLTRELPTLA